MLGWVLFLVAVLLLLWYYLRGPAAQTLGPGRRKRRARKLPAEDAVDERWRAVEVTRPAGAPGCAAAQALQGHRILISQAPRIPLADCPRGDCACYYEHFDDRRQGDRRAGHYLHQSVSAGLGIRDRRSGRDRRLQQPIAHLLPY